MSEEQKAEKFLELFNKGKEFTEELGDLYVPPDCDPAAPLIRTEPTRKHHAAPFDRPEPIG